MSIEEIKSKNTGIDIKSAKSAEFGAYGNVVTGMPFSQLDDSMARVEVPAKGDIYIPSVSELEQSSLFDMLKESFFGQMDLQIGYVVGNNSELNALEYHKGSEVVYALSDVVLLLGKISDVDDCCYDVKNVEAFYVPAGTAVELYATTLHFSPCKTSAQGFKCAIVLPKGTNTPFENYRECKCNNSELLLMKNKWVIAHPEAADMIKEGAFVGIKGDNIEVKF